ncbi:MAG TPA: helix-turn-helix transcriptional regulator [Pyrinomonadaceae bacterium]|nr:helix-turn-helix transcriptional regulator [Pyrinomonadaceae bacterium]HLE62731.1 helix-turn-helix transcriptional regulator [Pyrinomonadaceae bacterium]
MTTIRFEDWEKEQLRDPKFQAAAREQEPAYQIARLRILHGLTQKQLAELVGTQQPSIARLESGKAKPDLPFLQKIARVLGARVEVRIVTEKRVRAKVHAKAKATRRKSEPKSRKKMAL